MALRTRKREVVDGDKATDLASAEASALTASAPTAWKGIVLAALVGIVGLVAVVGVALRGRNTDADHRVAGKQKQVRAGTAVTLTIKPL
jgi:hypothetical protein